MQEEEAKGDDEANHIGNTTTVLVRHTIKIHSLLWRACTRNNICPLVYVTVVCLIG
jgi:hypothetical protein